MNLTRREWLAGGAALALGGAAAGKDDPIPAGAGRIDFAPEPKQPQRTLKVWTFRPDKLPADAPVLVVMHGVGRNGETYRDNWLPHARKHGALLLTPEFPAADYPGEAYAQGNVLDANGRPVAPAAWTFTAVERLFDHAKPRAGLKTEKYHLYGHSAGGQFVHRFVLLMPEARYARAVAANPGYYTFPTQAAKYPYGLKGTPQAGPVPAAVWGRDVVVLLGEADTNRDDPNLRKTPQADAQGLTRFERGKNFYRAAEGAAKEGKAAFRWRLATVPGVGHSDAKMSAAAARELFGK